MSLVSPEFIELQAALAGEYSLERELGRGGMGVVYLARDVQLDRLVAIKLLPKHLATSSEARERFLREARTAAGLSHPNIVPIHRVGEAAGFVFFVMSYVPGETLGERLREQGPLPTADAIRVLREVAWALAYAHGRGIVHRDVKPDNILLEEGSGRALVTDFGIAHVGMTTLSTDPGKVMGTAHFMSPEQALNEHVDARSDLYSLGAVGYLAVSGRLPFDAANTPAVLLKHITEPVPLLANSAPGIPRALAFALERCLAKDPADRYASGEEFAATLTPLIPGRSDLPAPLRTWLAQGNPALFASAVWCGVFVLPILVALPRVLTAHLLLSIVDLATNVVVLAVPLIPLVGFEIREARRLFHAGFTLTDIRGALDLADRERKESESLAPAPMLSAAGKALRWLIFGSFAAAIVLTFARDVIVWPLERRHILIPLAAQEAATLTAWLSTAVLLYVANLRQVPLLPESVRRFFRRGIRAPLWRSRLGGWLAKRLGAPIASTAVGASAFQRTEVALGTAATDLFNALPSPFRARLEQVPTIVAALEARAGAARAAIDSIDAVKGRTIGEVSPVVVEREVARAQLATSVAALEGIRLDLLRLHVAANDVAPMTSLLDAVHELGEHARRLAEARREISQELRRRDTPSA